ncbi:MAG: capsular polysaccharide synthesis protein, partial [Bacteroidales bacterium]
MGFFNDFKILYCDFGIRAAYKLAIKPRVYSKLGINSFSDSFNSSLLNYLENEYRPVIDKYRDIEKLGLNTTNCKFEKKIIWTCWWQGEEQM